MGVLYELVNLTKKERISFSHLQAGKARELAGYPPTAAIVTFYLLHNIGDYISFVPDQYYHWVLAEATEEEVNSYPDITDQIVQQVIDAGIIIDEGRSYEDKDDPENIFICKLRNIWID